MQGPETPKEAPNQAPESVPSSEQEVQKIEEGLKQGVDPAIAKEELRQQLGLQRMQAEQELSTSLRTRVSREEQVAKAGKVIDLIRQELDLLEGMEGQFKGAIAGVRSPLLSRWGYLAKVYPELSESKPLPGKSSPSKKPQSRPAPAKPTPQKAPPAVAVRPTQEPSAPRKAEPVSEKEQPAKPREDPLVEKQQARRQLEQQRVEAEKKYSTAPTEENAKAFIGAMESELQVLDRLPPVRRETDAGEQFVLSDRILSKRAQVLMSHPSLQEPNMQSPAVERVMQKRFTHEQRGGVSLELLHGAEDALWWMGILINDNGELCSRSEGKVLVGGKNVEKISVHEISRYTEGKTSVTLAVHFSEPFAARDFWSGELKKYGNQKNVETVVLTNGEVADRFANAKKDSYEEPGMINDEQCAKLSQKETIAEKIWEPTAAVFRRYERIPAKELTEQQATEMVQAKDRSEEMEREFRQRMEGSREWNTGHWNWGVPNTDFQDRYVQAKLRLEAIHFGKSEYSELFESPDVSMYESLPIDGELKQLIREAQKLGYAFDSSHSDPRGFAVYEDGREVAHIISPEIGGNSPTSPVNKKLVERLKDFIRNELSLRR